MRRSSLLATLAALSVLEVAVNVVLRPQVGAPALAAVLEAHLLALGAAAGLVAAGLSLRAGTAGAWVRLVAVVVLVVALVRVGGEWRLPVGSEAPTTGTTTLRVLSWNLELGSKAAAQSVAGIVERDADLVALQELTPDVAAAIEADRGLTTRYPYRILEPRDGVAGVGLLSRLPLVVGRYQTGPVILRAGLLLPDGRQVELFDVHPFPPLATRWAGLPVGIDARRRDEDLARIRSAVDALPDPASALVIGDLNASPLEPGYSSFAAGLSDAHATVGVGPGFTWRPSVLEVFGVGVLRIDYVLTGAWLRPVTVAEDCSIAGDHCRLYATLAVTTEAAR